MSPSTANTVIVSSDAVLDDDHLDALRVRKRVMSLARRGGGTLLAPVGPGGPLVIPGVRHLPLDLPVGLDPARRDSEAGERVGPIFDRLRPSLIHAFGVGPAIQAVLRRSRGVKVVVEPGITPAQRLRAEQPKLPPSRLTDLVAIEDKTLSRADAVIARSTVEAATLVRRGVPSEHVWTAPDGLPFEPREADPVDLPHVCFVGDLEPWSDWALPLDALARINDIPWRLTAVMPLSCSRGHLEHHARNLGLEHRVDFARLDLDEGVRRVHASQIVVAPLNDARPVSAGSVVPLAALWALACGRPLVAPDLPVVRAVAGSAARYYDPSDTGALAEALRALLTEPEQRAELAAQARAHREYVSWTSADAMVADVWSALRAS